MTTQALVDQKGRKIQTDRQIASGGEGIVYSLTGDNNRVAKLYHKAPSRQTIDKLKVMVSLANPRLLTLAAWPIEILLQEKTLNVVGFIMPRITDCQPIQHLYNPIQRLKHFPRANWSFQVRAAKNLAAVFEEIHKIGCLVGDVNQSNALVTGNALVRVIDCDSFQVTSGSNRYLCEVGVPHYTPPELQGKSFRGLVRTTNHDRFGLAVLIYQLLFVGRHPYAGIYKGVGDPSFEQLIAEFRFAQGPKAHTWGMEPSPFTPTFSDIPSEIGTLFQRSFEKGSDSGARPQPAEWVSAIGKMEAEITECQVDAGHKYWKGVKQCLWCRFADKGGPEYYFGVSNTSTTFAVDEAKLQEVIARLNRCQLHDFPIDANVYQPSTNYEPSIPPRLENYKDFEQVLFIVLIICTLIIPIGLVHPAFLLIGLLGDLVFGIWLLVLRFMSPWHKEKRYRHTMMKVSQTRVREIEHKWQAEINSYRRSFQTRADAIRHKAADCRLLAMEYQNAIQKIVANAELVARERHLRLYSIADAEISQFGQGRKRILASYLIYNAADITPEKLSSLRGSGIGEVLQGILIDWKESVLKQFKFNPSKCISPAEQSALNVKFKSKQKSMVSELLQHLNQLEDLSPSTRSKLVTLNSALRQAVLNWKSAEADYNIMRTLTNS